MRVLQKLQLCTTYNSGKGRTFPSIFGAISGLPAISGCSFLEKPGHYHSTQQMLCEVNSFLDYLLEPDFLFFLGKMLSRSFLCFLSLVYCLEGAK